MQSKPHKTFIKTESRLQKVRFLAKNLMKVSLKNKYS